MSAVRVDRPERALPYESPLRALAALTLFALAALAMASQASASRDLTANITVPAVVADNSTFTVNISAYNTGTGAGSSVEVQLYLDGNATAPPHNFGNLADGEYGNASENFTLSCGVYQFNATVDPSGGVPENNETNNNFSLIVVVMPFANFTAVQSGSPGAISLMLDATSSHGCAPLNYTWDIGGIARFGPTVTYTPPGGPLAVRLTVRSTANASLTNSLTRTVSIPNGSPTLTVGLPDDTIATLTPLAVNIQADDADGSVASYFIDFGDGNTTTVFGDAAAYVYHTSGNFTLSVRVTDNLGATVTIDTAIQVSNRAPVAELPFDFWATQISTPVVFDASASNDPEGGPVTIAWDFGDGTTGTGAVTNHTYDKPGSYTVTVTVTDANGETRTDTMTVRVDPTPTNWTLPIIGGILGLLLLLLLLLLLVRRRRPKDEDEKKADEKKPEEMKADDAKPGEGSSAEPPSP